MTCATILIPVGEEVEEIGRTLWFLARDLPLDRFRVVVVASGRMDAVAARATAALPQVRLTAAERPGRCHALNIGYRASIPGAPLICLDVDLDVPAGSLLSLLAPLAERPVLAACGRMDVETDPASSGSGVLHGVGRVTPRGARARSDGVIALSSEGARRVFPLPETRTGDRPIRHRFAARDIAVVPDCRFVVRAPRAGTGPTGARRRSLQDAPCSCG